MQHRVILLLVFRIIVASGYTLNLPSARTQAVERENLNTESGSQAILLPRTGANDYQSRLQSLMPSVEASDNGIYRDLSDFPLPKKQRVDSKFGSQSPVVNLAQHSGGSFNEYESQTSSVSSKDPERKFTLKQEEKEKAPLGRQESKRLGHKREERLTHQRDVRENVTREQKDRKNASARQRYKDSSPKEKERVRALGRERRGNMPVDQKKRYKERARLSREAKKDQVNARKRQRYHEKKIENQQIPKTSSTKARRNRFIAMKEKNDRRNRTKGLRKPRVDNAEKTISSDHDLLLELPAASGRYNLRQQRLSKIPEISSDSVSISSVSADSHARKPITGSDGELSLGALGNVQPTGSSGRVSPSQFGFPSPAMSEDRLSRILREGLPFMELESRAPSESTIQNAFKQFHTNEP